MDDQLQSDLNSDEWLRDLFDQAHDLIQIVHVTGTILYVNKAWSKVLGYSAEEIKGKSIYSFIQEGDKERYRSYRQQILEGGASEPIIFQLITKAGLYITVEGIVSAKNINGKPAYTRGIFRDITTRKNQESELLRLNKELKDKEQDIRQLLENAPDAVIVIDERSIITFWNPKAEELFGWKADEVLNSPLSDTIIPVQHREAHQKGMNRYLSTGEARVLNRTIEITALDKTGREFYISLSISPTTYLNKVSFISFIRNISTEKDNQEQLKQRTEALERSNKDLESFAHTASHDLKEPIRKMQLNADLLRRRLEGKLAEDDLVFFNRIEKAYHRANVLINDLLSYARLETDKNAYRPVNLNELVNQVIDSYDFEIDEKKSVITVGSLPVIHGHPGQLFQVFNNLIGNALKYCKENIQPHIQVAEKALPDISSDALPKINHTLEEYHIIEIKDNGIGFDKQYADRIFNVFTRLHSNDQFEGTGVGLSIVRRILENHKGYITVESKPGKGSCFYIFVPKKDL